MDIYDSISASRPKKDLYFRLFHERCLLHMLYPSRYTFARAICLFRQAKLFLISETVQVVIGSPFPDVQIADAVEEFFLRERPYCLRHMFRVVQQEAVSSRHINAAAIYGSYFVTAEETTDLFCCDIIKL